MFIGAFVVHIAFRIPVMASALRSRRSAHRAAHAALPDGARTGRRRPGWSPRTRRLPTMSRRGALGLVGAGSLGLLLVTAGQSIGGSAAAEPRCWPRAGRTRARGPTASRSTRPRRAWGSAPATSAPTGGWSYGATAASGSCTRAQLLALPQHTAALPIACVEGWSTDDQRLERRTAGGPRCPGRTARRPAGRLRRVRYSARGSFRSAHLRDNQVRDPARCWPCGSTARTLSPDHGYPARIIVPANPGVHNTKWVTRLTFGSTA